jgi:hypothetical protein
VRFVVCTTLALAGLSGCRGDTSPLPPIHLQQNMDFQHRFEMQEENPFFADRRASRPRVEGTVPANLAQEDDHLWRGKDGPGWAKTLPPQDERGRNITLNRAFLERGKSRFDIYCAPCHDAAGTGQGIVVQRGMFPPPAFNDPRLLGMPIGQLYDVVANGARNMPAYRSQIPPGDRWAVAAYVRALQVSRNASLNQIPADQAAAHGWGVR